ncbi:MAG: Hsp33 family molecular chaperone HslO [Desulfococcaceae bacterium]
MTQASDNQVGRPADHRADYWVRSLAEDGGVRAIACVTTELVAETCRRHGTWPTAAAALGRALTGGALMGALLKDRDRVALKFEGSGPLGKILVEADGEGAVSGYAGNPQVDLPARNGRPDVAGALGRAGFLTVTRDLGLREPYRSVVRLNTGEIGEDLAHYFLESEQVPSAVGVGVFQDAAGVTAAGGFLVQSLPGADLELVDRLIDHIRALPPVTEQLREGRRPEHMLAAIYGDVPFRNLEQRTLRFRCHCGRERFEQALVALGREEVAALAKRTEETILTCEFCRETYAFTPGDFENLLAEMEGTP